MRTIIFGVVILLPALSAAQGVQPPGGAEPSHGMVRAAGMPLNDTALAPGTITVRVVRGAFSENIADQLVELDVSGKTEQARTDAAGRAQFANLPIGARVRAAATVDGERLVSESFDVPAAGGVRLLLIAGGETSGATSLPPGHPDISAATTVSPASQSSSVLPSAGPSPGGVGIVRKTLASITVLAFAALFFRRYFRPV